MKLVRVISAFAYYISRAVAILYLLTVVHLTVSVLFKLSTLKLLNQGRFAITYPFSSKNFLLGSAYNFNYIMEMSLLIAFYCFFFWLLGNVFQTFRQKKLFTVWGIIRLKWFYLINLLFCPVLFIILSLISTEDYPYMVMCIAHGIMGIFAFFIAAIFEQGVNLQNDQDLII
jgi:hypothetical protein